MGLLLGNMNYNKFHRWTLLPCTLSSWICFQLLLHLLFIQSGMLVAVMGLHLESISVPGSGLKGSSIVLSCEFGLDDGEKLYSLKWYKDNHEIFRYMPQAGPNSIITFNRPGVLIDSSENRPLSANRVVFKLKNLRLSSGGAYKCEISADGTFKTLSKESNLTVIVLPNPPSPLLKVYPLHAQIGERIRGNCSFSKSHPAAKLTFFVNGAKVNNSLSDDITLKPYEPRVDGVIEDYKLSGGAAGNSGGSGTSREGVVRQYQYPQQQISSSSSSRKDGLNNGQFGGPGGSGIIAVTEKTYTSVTGIDIRLNRRHLLQWGQVLNIRCVASVVDQMWDAQKNITLHNYPPPQLSTAAGQNRYSSGSEYLVPIFSLVNVSFLNKTIKMALLIFTWTICVC